MPHDAHEAQILDPDAMEAYLLAGRARTTIVSKQTNKRFTYKVEARRTSPRREGETEEGYAVRKARALRGVRFVMVMTGADNENDYTYIGHISEDRRFRLDRRSRLATETPSVRAWRWFWRVLRERHDSLDQCEVWHDGRCARCGRLLTVPDSVARGLGPVCAAT
jgi:hypothetical protein